MIDKILNKIEGLIGSDLVLYLLCNGQDDARLLVGELGPDKEGTDGFWIAPKGDDFLYYYNLDEPLNLNSASFIGPTDKCIIAQCK